MYEYSFFKLDVNNPSRSISRINDMAREGWRVFSVVPEGAKALILLERESEVSVTTSKPKKCIYIKDDGNQCGAYAIKDSAYCIAHQPD